MARRRGNIFQADVLYKGKRKRKSFPSLIEAEAWEKSVELADYQSAPMPGEGLASTSEYTLGTFGRANFDYLWGDKKAVKSMGFQFAVIYREMGEDTLLTQINQHKIMEFVNELKRQGKANGTINRKMSALSKLLKHAKSLDLITEVPVFPKFAEAKGRIRFLTKPEEEQLFSYAQRIGLTESYHHWRFLLYSGCRLGETYSLEWRDVDLKANTVTFWKTKADLPRTIPITPPVRVALEWAREQSYSKPFVAPEDSLRTHWDRCRGALGYEDDPQYVMHMLRHTCASRLVQAGIDLTRVKAWLGHKNIQTTLRYAHLAPGDLDIAAEALAG